MENINEQNLSYFTKYTVDVEQALLVTVKLLREKVTPSKEIDNEDETLKLLFGL